MGVGAAVGTAADAVMGVAVGEAKAVPVGLVMWLAMWGGCWVGEGVSSGSSDYVRGHLPQDLRWKFAVSWYAPDEEFLQRCRPADCTYGSIYVQVGILQTCWL